MNFFYYEMGFYKTRYANRRRATRYRQKTYRSRYSPRYTPYKKRRFVYNKANKAEWKQTMPVSALQSLTIASHTYGTSLTVNPSSITGMLVGANPGQRIGRRLNANFIKMRWQADIIDAAPVINSISIRFFAIQVKGMIYPAPTPNTAPYRIYDLFPDLSTASGPADSSWQLAAISPFKDGITNSCRILFDKTYKLNANSSTSQVIFKRKIRMQPLKWEIAPDTTTDPTYNTQASNPVFFYWIVTNCTTASSDIIVPLNVMYRLVYTDS